MYNDYEHLRIERVVPVTARRTRTGFGRRRANPDPARHGQKLLGELEEIRELQRRAPGFDDRLLLKINIDPTLNVEELRLATGIEIVSQEQKSIVIAFATADNVRFFEERLTTMASGRAATRAQLLYALEAFSEWTPDDRRGWALNVEGFNQQEAAGIDIELWPIEDSRRRDATVAAFRAWLANEQITEVGQAIQPNIIIFRVHLDAIRLEHVLHHRDVRTVDLPPRYQLERSDLTYDLQNLGAIPAPAEDAGSVVVLDSGLVTAHPIIAPAVGDAQAFYEGAADPNDHIGHGTAVSSIALYGDLSACIESGSFVPEIRLFSGKLLDDDAAYDASLIESDIRSAVDYFADTYDCKVFNLSIGDKRKPYLGRRIGPLAVVIDNIAREKDVVFVVSIGNTSMQDVANTKSPFPDHLFLDEAALLDPATAISAITVGALARYERSHLAQRFPEDPAYRPIALREQPSPFTRHGPSVNGTLKPDLVAFGGNWATDVRAANSITDRSLGEASAAHDYLMGGRLFKDYCGTSFAAPYIAHLAARVATHVQNPTAAMIRALLIAHARLPVAGSAMFGETAAERAKARSILGYGLVDDYSLFRSTEDSVTLIASESIEMNQNHFYELPLPEEFLVGNRLREVSISLCYTPPVRSTRLEYKAVNIDFRFVKAEDLGQVVRMFNAATAAEEYDAIPELNGATVSVMARSKGANQSATWRFKRTRTGKYFIVVSRRDLPWGQQLSNENEPYSLVVVCRDREAVEPHLYTQIRAALNVQVQQRVRVM